MSIKSEIEREVRIAQRGTRLSKGDQFWRGLEVVSVTGVAGDKVSYMVISTGDKSTIDRKSFLSKSLIRVPKSTLQQGSYLRQVWSIVGVKTLPMRYRFTAAKKMLKDSPSPEDTEIVRGWMYAFSMEKEPKK